MKVETLVNLANEIQPLLPQDSRLDIQWNDQVLVITKNDIGFVIVPKGTKQKAFWDDLKKNLVALDQTVPGLILSGA